MADGQGSIYEVTCALCQKRISMTAMATAQIIFVKGRMLHLSCTQDKSIEEVERAVSSHPRSVPEVQRLDPNR